VRAFLGAGVTAALLVGLVTPAHLAAAQDTLGFGINVIPDRTDQSDGALRGNQALWFAMSPGESITREFEIVSASDVEQDIEAEVLGLVIVNGEDQVDKSALSEVAPWVSFSPTPLVLPPRERAVLTMTVAAPLDAEGAFQAYARIRATATQIPTTQGDDETKAIIKGALAFDQRLWIGIGESGSLTTDFEIVDAVGLTVDEARTLQIEFANTGETPVAPRGTVELQSLDFTTLRVGPLDFGTATVLPGQSRYAQVILPEEVEPGPWKLLVIASQGNIKKTATFERDLTFPLELPSPTPLQAWQLALLALGVILGLCLLVFGWRTLKSGSSEILSETEEVTEVDPIPTPALGAPSKSPDSSQAEGFSSSVSAPPAVSEAADWAAQEADRIIRDLGLGEDPKR